MTTTGFDHPLVQEAMQYPTFGPGSERRYDLLREWHALCEQERQQEERNRMGQAIAECGLAVGDKVRRRKGRQDIGVVESIYVPQGTYRAEPRARVHWLSGQHRIGGGRDFHTTVQATQLVKVEE